jgi:hypothetical protein
MNTATIGKWAFILGLVIAVVAGIFFQPDWAIWVLAILGVIVGFLNITTEDTRSFLLAVICPAVCGSLCRCCDDRGRIKRTVPDRPLILITHQLPKMQKQVADRCLLLLYQEGYTWPTALIWETTVSAPDH